MKKAKEILLNKFPLLPESSNKEGMDRIIEAMQEYADQQPLPTNEKLKKIRNDLIEARNANDRILLGFAINNLDTLIFKLKNTYQSKQEPLRSAESLIQWLEDFPQEFLSESILKHGIAESCKGFAGIKLNK